MMPNMPDIPRLYTAFAEWFACMIFIVPLKKKKSISSTIILSVVMLFIQNAFLIITDDVNFYLWIPCMLIAIVLMIVFIFLCCDLNINDAIYFGMFAFVIAEFMASLEWQLVCYFWNVKYSAFWIGLTLLILSYFVFAFVLYKIIHTHLPVDGKLNVTKKETGSAILIGIIIFAVSNLSFLSLDTPFTSSYSFEIGNIRTMVDFGGVAILYAHLMQCGELRIRRELETVQNVLQNQYVQYKQSRESVDLINYKYHDLKHQIALLRNEKDSEKREEFLNKMEEEIRLYEAQNKTGNSVLDTLLTTKSLYCAKHGITLTVVADGSLLNFMDVMDICSIFGNALDNAIECELKIPDKEKRLVHVTVSRQKNFLLIRFENYYEGILNIQEGKLMSTKKDKDFHGYGLKSIRYTVEQYDGAVTIDTNDNWFDLKILIPIKQDMD